MAMHWVWELMEAPVTDVASLRRRTNALIVIHLVLAASAIGVIALVIWRAPLLVTLTQRSNVETLLIAFVLVYALYVLATTMPATLGALRLLGSRAMGRDRSQRSLQAKARRDRKETKRSYLNVVVRGPRDQPVEVPIEDRYGKLGTLKLDLATLGFADVPNELTHSTMQLVAKELGEVGELEGTDLRPKIVFWDSIDEEQAHWYASQVSAFARLERALESKPLWPALRLNADGVDRLRTLLRDAAPSLRECLLLPDIEYSAEFSIPVIPEPLALMQLRRQSAHADAIASMGCVMFVMVVFMAVLALVLVAPPWVPGK